MAPLPGGQRLPSCLGEHLQFQNLGFGHPVGAVIGKAASRAPALWGPVLSTPLPSLV